jgi:hypothetical protein
LLFTFLNFSDTLLRLTEEALSILTEDVISLELFREVAMQMVDHRKHIDNLAGYICRPAGLHVIGDDYE